MPSTGPRISNLVALVYGAANLMGVGSGLIVSWLLYFYCPPESAKAIVYAPIVAMGAVILFGRVVDAVSDPLIGYWSDKTVTRWGRRKPFIVMGFVLMALSQVLIWLPPVRGESLVNVAYAAAMLGIFWFGFTAAIAPYLALLPEMTQDPGERVKLSTFQAFFSQVSTVINGVVVPIMIAALGFFNSALVLTLIALSVLIPFLVVVKEKPPEEIKAAKLSLVEAVRITFTNKVFLYYLVPTALLVLGVNMLQMDIPYLVTVSAGLEKQHVSLFYLPLILVSVLMLPVVRRAAGRYGKKRVYLWGMALFGIPIVLLATVGLIPLSPIALIVAVGVLTGIAAAPLFVLPNAIIADITDIDEQMTGYRREAIYFGAQGLITKSMAGLAGVLNSALLGYLGYAPGNDLGIRMVLVVAGLALIPAVLIFRRYPITK